MNALRQNPKSAHFTTFFAQKSRRIPENCVIINLKFLVKGDFHYEKSKFDSCIIVYSSIRHFLQRSGGYGGMTAAIRSYYKCGTNVHTIGYGAAHAPSLSGPYIHTRERVTDNLFYIEDAKAFSVNGAHYILTTDNFGTNTGIFGALMLWKERDGTFSMSDASLAFGRLCDYTALPPQTTYASGESSTKLERPGLLLENGVPTYLTGCTRTSVSGTGRSEIYLFRLKLGNIGERMMKLLSYTPAVPSDVQYY